MMRKSLGRQIDEAALEAKRGVEEAKERLLGLLDRYILKAAHNFMGGRYWEDVAQELRVLLFEVLGTWEPGKGREFRQYYIGSMKKVLWRLKRKYSRWEEMVSLDEFLEEDDD